MLFLPPGEWQQTSKLASWTATSFGRAKGHAFSGLCLVLDRGVEMYIEELVLEGFKSYPVRTQITGWDPSFNCITGLNGSGKSNILDAICFVLGLTNMSQVRSETIVVWLGRAADRARSTRFVLLGSRTKPTRSHLQTWSGWCDACERDCRIQQLRQVEEPDRFRTVSSNYGH